MFFWKLKEHRSFRDYESQKLLLHVPAVDRIMEDTWLYNWANCLAIYIVQSASTIKFCVTRIGCRNSMDHMYSVYGSVSYPRKHTLLSMVLKGTIKITTIISYTVYVEIFTRRKFSPISPSALIGEIFYRTNFLSCVNDYIEDMATFYCIGKNLFHQIFL